MVGFISHVHKFHVLVVVLLTVYGYIKMIFYILQFKFHFIVKAYYSYFFPVTLFLITFARKTTELLSITVKLLLELQNLKNAEFIPPSPYEIYYKLRNSNDLWRYFLFLIQT